MADNPLNLEGGSCVLQLRVPTSTMGDSPITESSRSPTSPQTMLIKVTELLRNESTDEAAIDGDERRHSLADDKEDGKHHDPWSLPESSDTGPNWSGTS